MYYIAHLLNNMMLVTISTLVVDVNDEEPPLGQSSKTGIGGKVPKSFHELDSAGTRVERLEHIVIWWKSECGRAAEELSIGRLTFSTQMSRAWQTDGKRFHPDNGKVFRILHFYAITTNMISSLDIEQDQMFKKVHKLDHEFRTRTKCNVSSPSDFWRQTSSFHNQSSLVIVSDCQIRS